MVKRLSAKEIEMELEFSRQIEADVNSDTLRDDENYNDWIDYERQQLEEQYERKFYY